MTSLVGHSGAGKSTILNLIPRFYDVQSGDIMIDDQSIYKVKIKSLQKAIADIGHDTPLFKATKQSYNSLPKCCFYKEEKIH